MYKIFNKIINFITNAKEKRRAEWTTGRRTLGQVKRAIFLEDSFSPELFVIAIMSVNYVHTKCSEGYTLTKSQEKITHLIYIDDIKAFQKNEKELETRIQKI